MEHWLAQLAKFPLTSIAALALYATLIAAVSPQWRSVINRYLGTAPNYHPHTLLGFDAIRGGAALLIVLGHCVYFALPAFAELPPVVVRLAGQATKAVPIFGVLSGFLIYRAVLAIKTIDDIRSYCTRRFFRIYPAYAAGVILALVLGQYASPSMSPDTSASARFFADLFVMRVLWWPGFGNPVAWSLYHEVLFYALLPLIVLTIGRQRVAPFAIAGLAMMLLADYPGRDYGLYKYFIFGILASIYSDPLRPYAAVACIIGLILIGLEFFGIDILFILGLTPAKVRWGGGFGLGLGPALVLGALPHLGTVGRAFNILPFRILGIISYSLYVIHPFVLNLIFPESGILIEPRDYSKFSGASAGGVAWMFFILIPSIIFWAMMCYLMIERPFIRFGAALLKSKAHRTNPQIVGTTPEIPARAEARAALTPSLTP